MSARVVILTKAPVPGQVKTRLAEGIGSESAAYVHELMVFETIRRAQQTNLDVIVSLANDEHAVFAKHLSTLGVAVEPQARGDLGDRLAHAMRHPGLSIALGTDCVVFDPSWLTDAAESAADASVGPSDDGGYWMIALDGSNPKLSEAAFSDMPWSTPTLFAKTQDRLRSSGFSLNRVSGAYDVDDLSDLRRLATDQRCADSIRSAVKALL